MRSGDVVLGVDFGTSNTAASLVFADGRTRSVLFDGSPLLPSAVCVDGSTLLVGRDAIQAATFHPAGAEFHPKQRIDDGTVLLSGTEYPVADLIVAVLRRVVDEATRSAGTPPTRMVLGCPAAWGAHRRETLLAAATTVMASCELVAEPVAAAASFVTVAPLAVGSCALVYDLGAGTFDASVVRRTADGFSVLAEEGIVNAGGLDLDATIVAHLGATYGSRDPDAWQRLTSPATDADRRASRQLWDAVRNAKETLSRRTATKIEVPLLEDDAPLGREQLDSLARPLLDRTVAASRAALATARIPAADLAGVYLVGGASRYPLVATLLHQAFGVTPTTVEQPELAVAEGAAGPGASDGTPPTRVLPAGAAPRGRRFSRRAAVLAAGVATITIAGAVALALRPDNPDNPADPRSLVGSTTPSTTTPSASATPTPTPSPKAYNPLIDQCLIGAWQATLWEGPATIGGVDVTVNLVGTKLMRHYDGKGTVWEDLRDGVVRQGKKGGRTYQQVFNGFTVWGYRSQGDPAFPQTGTSRGRAFFQNARTKGRIVTKVDGSVRNNVAFAATTSPEEYFCTTTVLTVQDDDGSRREYKRVSPTPAPRPKL
ncbi:Hsp70 protein [Asanoa ferruginea]|uniref:Hsp70 protein n=1 Tax=Asanoa ferruginea TaxID=53367 RepID=A0A3E0A1F1_9ACTN|nr:Hsp70 family protein [Asanoa ferruginea]REG00071.1 Hsp70 protein [Asanoa ferruginea]GIF46236.1 hypothetical protein Afe04nite_07750 [Asanoa ferruginea]